MQGAYDVLKVCVKFLEKVTETFLKKVEDSMGFGGLLGFSVRFFSHLGVRTFRSGTGDSGHITHMYVNILTLAKYCLRKPPPKFSLFRVLM